MSRNRIDENLTNISNIFMLYAKVYRFSPNIHLGSRILMMECRISLFLYMKYPLVMVRPFCDWKSKI